MGLVQCQDCGYRWESSADSPRCSQSECGRSRNVEPVADQDEQDAEDELDQDDAEQDTDQDEQDAEDELDQDDAEQDDSAGGGYEPAFETREVRTDHDDRGRTDHAEQDADQDDAEQDADQDDTKQDDGEQFDTEDVPELDPDQLEPAIDATFGMIAVSRGEHWELDEDETEKLAAGWTPVLNHYAPALLRENALLVTAAITSYGVLAPRIAEDRKRAAEQEAAAVDDAADAGQVRKATTEQDDQDDSAGVEQPDDAGEPGGYASV